MSADARLGTLREPLSGRVFDPAACRERVIERAALLAQAGFQPGDRMFLHYGNSAEFFFDVMAVWLLGGCAVPVDPRLTAFEIETLAARGPAPLLGLRSRSGRQHAGAAQRARRAGAALDGAHRRRLQFQRATGFPAPGRRCADALHVRDDWFAQRVSSTATARCSRTSRASATCSASKRLRERCASCPRISRGGSSAIAFTRG